jgi:hypothetical protein
MRARRRSRNHAAAQPDKRGGRSRVANGNRPPPDLTPSSPSNGPAPRTPRIDLPPPPTGPATAASVVQGIRATRAYRLRFGQVGRVSKPPTRRDPMLRHSQRANAARRQAAWSRKDCRILPWTVGSGGSRGLPFPAIGILLIELRFRVVHCARTSGRFNLFRL